MTREEALEILPYLRSDSPVKGEWTRDDFDNAIKIAQEALSETISFPRDLLDAVTSYPVEGAGYDSDGGEMDQVVKERFDAFVRGANWEARQGVSTEAEVTKLADRVWVTPTDVEKFHQEVFDNFVAGEKVVIQIRKK